MLVKFGNYDLKERKREFYRGFISSITFVYSCFFIDAYGVVGYIIMYTIFLDLNWGLR